jgi:hypothetical protein
MNFAPHSPIKILGSFIGGGQLCLFQHCRNMSFQSGIPYVVRTIDSRESGSAEAISAQLINTKSNTALDLHGINRKVCSEHLFRCSAGPSLMPSPSHFIYTSNLSPIASSEWSISVLPDVKGLIKLMFLRDIDGYQMNRGSDQQVL